MSLNLITGYSGTSHITSASDGCTNAGLYGKGKYVLNIAEKFGAEIISNNLIRIKSGYAINQGRKIELAINDYEEVEIDNGLQGVKRCDLIVIHYEKNLTTGIETGSVKVIKGTSGDTYSDPAYTSGDIINGANEDDFLLYRVKINGLSIEAVEPLFTVTESLMTLLDNMQENSKKLMGEADISKIGNGTVKGAIVALADSDKKINQSLGKIKLLTRVAGEGNITSAFKKINLCSVTLSPGKYMLIATVQSTNVSNTSAFAEINNGTTTYASEEFTGGGGFFMQTNIPVVLDLPIAQTIYLDIQSEASSGYWVGSFTGLQVG